MHAQSKHSPDSFQCIEFSHTYIYQLVAEVKLLSIIKNNLWHQPLGMSWKIINQNDAITVRVKCFIAFCSFTATSTLIFEFLVERTIKKIPQWFNAEMLNSIQRDIECQISSNFWNSVAFAAIAFVNPFQQIACRSSCLHHHMHIWLFSWQAIRIMFHPGWFMAFLAYLLNSLFTLHREKEKKKALHVKISVIYFNMIYAVRLNRSSELSLMSVYALKPS